MFLASAVHPICGMTMIYPASLAGSTLVLSNLFSKRTAFKPFEYPEALGYKDAIRHSYWVHTEWNFQGDIQDYHVRLSPVEREAVKRAVLAISQVEVSVKRFWADLGKRFPKPEFEQVGMTFAESEVRHADAYSHILEVLGLNSEFDRVLEVPAIRGRVDYLQRALAGAGQVDDEQYAQVLALFSLFVENVSLFSQFAVLKSFSRHRQVLKDLDNVVQATQQEETVHALFGAYMVNLVRDAHPEWFNAEFYQALADACMEAYQAECEIIDWIFEEGDLPFLPPAALKAFVQRRFNDSLAMIGGEPLFDVDPSEVATLRWFEEELLAEVSADFFHKRPTTYSKFTQSVTAADLF